VTRLRVAFFGLPLAACLLARDGHELCLAVLSPVAGPGRRRLSSVLPPEVPLLDLLESADSDFALPTPTPEDLTRLLQRAKPDLLVSWFWTRRLTAEQLAVPRLGGIGAHPSLLPRHRGPNPFFAAIDQGDRETGVTVHRLTPEYDEGNLLDHETIEVGTSDAWQLARRLDRPSLRLLRRTVDRIAAHEELSETPQDPGLVSWAPEPTGALLRADWRWPSERIARRVRALSPVPGLALEISGLEFFALQVDVTDDYPRALLPGESAVVSGAVVVRTGDGAVRILRAQLASAGADLENGSDESEVEDAAEVVDGAELARRVAFHLPPVVDSTPESGGPY
jgi:methionyl-tRNA formyltransferase